jgi:predicted nucleotidyltransferase
MTGIFWLTGVVLFGSMLRVDMDKLGDFDIGGRLKARERTVGMRIETA